MESLEDFILSLDLMEIKPCLRKYTWSQKIIGQGYIAARLNKFHIHHYFLIYSIVLFLKKNLAQKLQGCFYTLMDSILTWASTNSCMAIQFKLVPLIRVFIPNTYEIK